MTSIKSFFAKIFAAHISKKISQEPNVDQPLSQGAPNEIPLWYFDEENGYWIEEGKLTKMEILFPTTQHVVHP